MDDKWGGHKPAAMRLAPQNPVPAPARCRRDAGTAAAVTAQPEPARCIASLHFRRLSAAGCAAGGRNCRSRPSGGPLLQCYLGVQEQHKRVMSGVMFYFILIT